MCDAGSQKTAVLLIAHGSRRADANDDLPRLAEVVRQHSPYPLVEISYLELAQPSIPEGAERCVAWGAETVLLLPYFLSAGAHAAGDLDRFRRELSDDYPDVTFRLCQPLGLHRLMVEIVLDRLREGEENEKPD